MKKIFSGFESSGKSLKLAMTAVELVYRNSNWLKKTSVARPIWSNIAFSLEFRTWAEQMRVPILYWKDLEEITHLEEADIICDEVGNYFDSRMWADLSLDVRRWLTQGAKTGIEFYGGAQDFAQVDKSFRRLVQPGDLVHVTKVIGSPRPSKTKPPVKYIWGICMTQSLNPQGYDEDKKQFESSGIPSFFFIRRQVCQIFDTGQKLDRSKLPALRHQERFCENDDCAYHKIQHI
jgi:hypothetical protein